MARLLFFAAIREAAGVRALDVDAATVGEALKLATERYDARFAKVLDICTILHGDSKVARDRWWDEHVGANDEIAVLPPVSGGEDFRMVDVGDKDETKREATAACRLVCAPATRDRLLAGEVAKGDAVGAAKVAGMLAAKRVPELIPLCHPVRTTFVEVTTAAVGDDAIEVRATVRGRDRTGFEMEALTACAIAALSLYDMGKAEDPRMRIDGLRIVAKSGGKSGSVTYE
ncbi:MAG TPA: cyclic pyranopterin monophosphate synthase MoaC [Actinomycetota bacterium]|nr:cyclic pyranopterin monophosphate synthase MoaC [Actinomycetota bacterium]